MCVLGAAVVAPEIGRCLLFHSRKNNMRNPGCRHFCGRSCWYFCGRSAALILDFPLPDTYFKEVYVVVVLIIPVVGGAGFSDLPFLANSEVLEVVE